MVRVLVGGAQVEKRTFVFRGGPELGQLGIVRPIKFWTQMKDRTVLPLIIRRGGNGTPLNAHMVFRYAIFEKRITNDDLDRIWVNCTDASKGDVGSGVENRGEDKVCSQKDYKSVNGPGQD
jgi:hypothetical protein